MTAGLEAWRDERRLTAESQKGGYLINIMEELGELAQALRDYEKYTNYFKDCVEPFGYEGKATNYQIKQAEHEIIDALCDIAVFTINAGADVPCDLKRTSLEAHGNTQLNESLAELMKACAIFSANFSSNWNAADFNIILDLCSKMSLYYGFNFEIAMLETIKEINSRTGAYDESAKKWVKDTSEQAKAKWYKANYEKARMKNE